MQSAIEMSGYNTTDLTTNIENSRNSLRRIARNDDHEFSKDSIINVIEKFVKTVNGMDETILIPCRLMDLKIGDTTDSIAPQLTKQHHHHARRNGHQSIKEVLNSADLLNVYNMLNGVKVDLLWNGSHKHEQQELEDAANAGTVSQVASSNDLLSVGEKDSSSVKGHIRRPSTVSVTSSNSVCTLSDNESEISNENDSGIESESNQENDKAVELAKHFRQHLNGLYRCLEQMTEAANYLSTRYQSDVGSV